MNSGLHVEYVCDIVLTINIPVLQALTIGLQCQICHVMFLDQSAINAHYDTAHTGTFQRAKPGEGAHACDVCDKRFSSKPYLRHHMAKSHGVGEVEKFQCDLCSRVFGHKSHLNRHIRQIHG